MIGAEDYLKPSVFGFSGKRFTEDPVSTALLGRNSAIS